MVSKRDRRSSLFPGLPRKNLEKKSKDPFPKPKQQKPRRKDSAAHVSLPSDNLVKQRTAGRRLSDRQTIDPFPRLSAGRRFDRSILKVDRPQRMGGGLSTQPI